MPFIQNLLRYISWLSLDVVMGAMAGMYFFAKLLHAPLQWPAYGLLALAVWVIYTTDHLLDIRGKERLDSSRRHFHAQNRLFLLIGVVLATILGGVGAFWWFGWGKELQLTLILAALILGSRLLIRKLGPGWMKELSIAVFYVVGILWLPVIRAEAIDITWMAMGFVPIYILLAFLNLLMLSFLDQREDEAAGYFSAAQTLTPQALIQVIRKLNFILIFVALGAFIVMPSFFRAFACVVLLMALIHYVSFFNARLAAETKRIRMEWSFMLPVLLFAF